ncbi:hypothetical protein HK103_001992 [Boothiomyces macroporosus]|uniref:Uncharacterized protein n=1 Tax=Boothiomyces macroporosus TaxID=261099 RepID=A0AAD5Y4Z7_9FUNG|nr:hypothetical protein HK103_002930 [Boothiomyces macroporosus]KAJ3251927.1 hypothetical protein HK103_001992 [Boothiomyces macroporosus]
MGNCSNNVADTASGYTIGQLAAVALIARTGACVQNNDQFCLPQQIAELPSKSLNETSSYIMSNKTFTCTNCTLKQIQAIDALPLSNMDASVTGPLYQATKSIVDFCGFTNIQNTGNNISRELGLSASPVKKLSKMLLFLTAVVAKPLDVECSTFLNQNKQLIDNACGQYMDLNSISTNGVQTLFTQITDNLNSICNPQCQTAVNNFVGSVSATCAGELADTSSLMTVSQLAAKTSIIRAGACVRANGTYCLVSQKPTFLGHISSSLNTTLAVQDLLNQKTLVCTSCVAMQLTNVSAIPLSSLDQTVAGPVQNEINTLINYCNWQPQKTANSAVSVFSSLWILLLLIQ